MGDLAAVDESSVLLLQANLRVFTFYIVLFQIIVTIAHDVPFQQDVRTHAPSSVPMRCEIHCCT